MSSSDRFDIVTNILSFLFMFSTLLRNSLPRARLMSVENALDHAENNLNGAAEEGLLGNEGERFKRQIVL